MIIRTSPRNNPPRRSRTAGKAISRVGAALLLVITAIWLVLKLHAAPPINIEGSIRCASGDALEGVWINASISTSGWAVLTLNPDTTTEGNYGYTLSVGGTYQVHVGCGGTSHVWRNEDYSPFMSARTENLSCVDGPTPAKHGTCVAVTGAEHKTGKS
jgi:hypothetical protein